MIRLRLRISAAAKGGDVLPLGAVSASAQRSGLALTGDQSSFVASSTRMGPPLTECPGWCRAFEREQAGSPIKGNHDCLRRATRVLGVMTGSGTGIGCRFSKIDGLNALRERAARGRSGFRAHALRKSPQGVRLEGRAPHRLGAGDARAGNDCDAFAPRWSGPGRPSGNGSG